MDLDIGKLIETIGVPGTGALILVWVVAKIFSRKSEEELVQTNSQADTNKAFATVFTESQLHALKREDLLIAAKDEVIKAYQQLSQYENKYKTLETQVQHLTDQLKLRDERVKDLENQVKELHDLVVDFKRVIQQRDTERNQMEAERNKLLNYIARLESQILVLRVRLEKLDTQTLRALSVEVDAIETNIDQEEVVNKHETK